MKTTTSIFLLALLLCNMLGLSVAELLFESGYKNAGLKVTNQETEIVKIYLPSIPYAAPMEGIDLKNELLRIGDRFYNSVRSVHQDDTLYVTVTANVSAHQRFAELSDMVREVHEETFDTGKRLPVRAIKSLNDLIKIYIPAHHRFVCQEQIVLTEDQQIDYNYLHRKLSPAVRTLNFPPPEGNSFPG